MRRRRKKKKKTTGKKNQKKQLIYCVWASLLLFLIVPFLENEIQLCIFSYKKYALRCFENDILLSKSVVTYQSLVSDLYLLDYPCGSLRRAHAGARRRGPDPEVSRGASHSGTGC